MEICTLYYNFDTKMQRKSLVVLFTFVLLIGVSFAFVCHSCLWYILALYSFFFTCVATWENAPSEMCAKRTLKSAFASVQSDHSSLST